MCQTATLVCLAAVMAGPAKAESTGQHPLLPILDAAEGYYRQIDRDIADYTCVLVKRERVDGRLLPPEVAQVKLRHERVRDGRIVTPFSVYLRFQAPNSIKGREIIYIRGENNGKLIARKGGPLFPFITAAVHPNSTIAMQRNRYPVTEIGNKNLLRRLYEVGMNDLRYDESTVEYFHGVQINQRSCTAAQITHPVRRPYFRYHIARIFIDDELRLPVRYDSYDWPETEGGPPRLIEEYTYLDIKLNVGLTDRDFDYRNEDYRFRKDFTP